jgi:hypothetical protein
MPIAFIFSSDKIGQAEYDGLMRALGRESLDVPTPAGSLAHLSGPKPGGGWQVIDVWDSEESANAFYVPRSSPPSPPMRRPWGSRRRRGRCTASRSPRSCTTSTDAGDKPRPKCDHVAIYLCMVSRDVTVVPRGSAKSR